VRLGILVDAACDLPLAFIARNPIRVVPIPIRIGDREVVDVRDEDTTGKFFEHILAAGVTDAMVHPYAVEQLEALFLERLVIDFDYVICLGIASQRSPIFETMQKFAFQILTKYKPLRQAAGVSGPFAMRVFDSGNMFAAQGVQVLELARLIRADTPVTRINQRMEEVIAQTYGYMVPSDLDYLHARTRRDKGVGFIGHALGNALDMKPIVRCFRGETGPVAKVRHFAAAAERVFANVTREIESGLLAPFVNLSYGGDWAAIARLRGFATLAGAASKHGVEVCWSRLSMSAGVDIGPGALTVGIVAQPHAFT